MQIHHQKLQQREGDTVRRAGVWFNPSAGLEDFTRYLYANGG